MEKEKTEINLKGITEEELLEVKTAVDKKRKTYNSPQDIMTVVTVFAVLALACALASWVTGNSEAVTEMVTGTSSVRKQEEAKQVSYLVSGIIAAVSAFIIFFSIRSMRKRKKKEAREFELKELKRLELVAAKRRVANARSMAREEMPERRVIVDDDDFYYDSDWLSDIKKKVNKENKKNNYGFFERVKRLVKRLYKKLFRRR